MTAGEAMLAVELAGGRLVMSGSAFNVFAPEGALGESVFEALRRHKAEILEHLRVSRSAEVSAAIAAAYFRLDRYAPWKTSELSSVRELAKALDDAATSYIQHDTPDLDEFNAALARWERRLVEGKAAATTTGGEHG